MKGWLDKVFWIASLIVFLVLVACSQPQSSGMTSDVHSEADPATEVSGNMIGAMNSTREPTEVEFLPSDVSAEESVPESIQWISLGSISTSRLNMDKLKLMTSASNDSCQLPCWFGLRPGVTTIEELRNFYSNAIGFENTSMIVMEDTVGTVGFGGTLFDEVPNSPNRIGIETLIDFDSHVLSEYRVDWSGYGLTETLTLRDIYTQIGPPDEMWIRVLDAQTHSLTLILIYGEEFIIRTEYGPIEMFDTQDFIMCVDDIPNSVILAAPQEHYTDKYLSELSDFSSVFNLSISAGFEELIYETGCLDGTIEPVSQ